MTARIFLNEQQWSVILGAVYSEVEKHKYPSGALAQTWRLLAQANRFKRFSMEVENLDILSEPGARDRETNVVIGWPSASHRSDHNRKRG